MKIANLFLNPENIHKLYVYEILNLNHESDLEIENQAFNIFLIGNEKIIEGFYNQPNFNLGYDVDDGEEETNKLALIKQNLNYEFFTNTNFDFFNQEKKFIFLKEKFNANKNQTFYLATDNSSQSLGDLDELLENEANINIDEIVNEDYLLTLELMPINQIQVFKNTKFKFVYQNKNIVNEINNINLSFDNNFFINKITVLGDLKKNNVEYKNVELPIADLTEELLIPFFVNPISHYQQLSFYLPAFNANQNVNFVDILNNFQTNKEFLLINFLDEQTNNFVLDLIEKTQILMNGFNGWNDQQINQFKEKYASNQPEDYVNYQISDYLNQNQFKTEKWKAKFRWVLLSLSQYLKSNFNFKGGLTNEHKLYMNFYLVYDLSFNSKFKLESNFWIIDKHNQSFTPIFNNISKLANFEIDGQILNLNHTPIKIEPQFISNNPIDFNDKSFNFNYFNYLIIKKNDIDKLKNLFGSVNEKRVIESFITKKMEINWNYVSKRSEYIDSRRILIIKEEVEPAAIKKLQETVKNNKAFWLKKIRDDNAINSEWIIDENNFDFIDIKVIGEWSRGASGLVGRSNYTASKIEFKIKIYITKNIVNIISKKNENHVFNWLEWNNYLIENNLAAKINLNLELDEEWKNDDWKISKLNKVIINHLGGKKFDLSFGNLNFQNLNFFSKKNELLTQTVIKL